MVQVKPNLVFFGVQGSGKSTQAKELSKKNNYSTIFIGNILRYIAQKNTTFGKKIKKNIDTGKLIPEDILYNKIIYPKLIELNKKNGIIFDGIPRNIRQLKIFNKILKDLNIAPPYLIFLDLPIDISTKRILSRKICPKCENVYIAKTKEYNNNMCNKCKTELIQRKDDQDIKIIKKRFHIFENQTKKILSYYKKNNLLIKIDANKSVNGVNNDIIKKINEIYEPAR